MLDNKAELHPYSLQYDECIIQCIKLSIRLFSAVNSDIKFSRNIYNCFQLLTQFLYKIIIYGLQNLKIIIRNFIFFSEFND